MEDLQETIDGYTDIPDDDLGDLGGFGEIDDTISYPHIKVNSKRFIEVLKVAKVINSIGGKDIIAKSICLEAEGNQLNIYSTDFSVYIKDSIEILNYQNILDKPIMLSTDVLIKLMHAVGSSVIFFEKEGLIYVRLYGGDMMVETYQFDTEKFKYTKELEHVTDIPIEDIRNVISDLSPIVFQAIAPDEKRIIFHKEGAFVNYLWTYISCSKSFENFDLKPKDLKVLQLLLAGKEGFVKVYKPKDDNTDRIVFVVDNFYYVFLLSDMATAMSSKRDTSSITSQTGVFVDYTHLQKLVWIASNLSYTLGTIGFRFTEEGIELDIKTKKEYKAQTTPMKLLGSLDGVPPTFKEEVEVQAKQLLVLLKSFKNNSIKIHLSSAGLGISSDEYTSVIFC